MKDRHAHGAHDVHAAHSATNPHDPRQDAYRVLADEVRFEAGVPVAWRFQVVGPEGVVTRYRVQHERELHLIVVRNDLTSFAHLHPERSPDGTWVIDLTLPAPGRYTAFFDVAPHDADPATLRLALEAPGAWRPVEPTGTTRRAAVDGYEIELRGDVAPGEGSGISFGVRKGSETVDPAPYLGAAGHLVAVRAGDLDYLHVHPLGPASTGEIPFMMHAPGPGTYRLFLQFLHGGRVRTADFTLTI